MKKAIAFILSFIMVVSIASSALAGLPAVLRTANNNGVKPAKVEQSIWYNEVGARNRSEKIYTNNLSTKADDKLIGFVCADADFVGWVEIDLHNPDEFNILSTTDANEVFAAEYNAITEDTYAFWYDAANNGCFGSVDVENGVYNKISNSPKHISGLSMDYTRDTMYALAVEDYEMYTVDLATGEFTSLGLVNGTSDLPFIMAISTTGIMYIIDFSGNLYTVDKDTLDASLIGSTGLTIGWAQSLTYDHDTNKIYWAHYNINGGDLYEVNPDTAEVTYLGLAGNAEITGLHTRPSEIPTVEPIDLEGVQLNKSEIDLIEGETFKLNAILLPQGGYFLERGVVYSTDNDEIASVSASGLVTAEGAGTATITVTTVDGGYTDTCIVNVESAAVAYREISDAMNSAEFGTPEYYVFSTNVGSNYPFVTTTDGDRECVVSTNQGVDASSSVIQIYKPMRFIGGSKISFDWKVSSESGYDGGQFFLNSEAVATITGDQDWQHVEYEIQSTNEYVIMWRYYKDVSMSSGDDCLWIDNVAIEMIDGSALEGIDVNPESITTIVGATQQLHVTFTPINADNTNVTFTSSNPDVATVSTTGLVKAVGNGTAVITVVSEEGSFTDTVDITVSEPWSIENLPPHPVTPDNTYRFDLDGSDGSRIISLDGINSFAYMFSIDMEFGDGAILTVSEDITDYVDDPIMYVFNENFEFVGGADDTYGSYPELKFLPSESGTYYIVVTTYFDYTQDNGHAYFTVTNYTPIVVTDFSVEPATMTIGVGRAGRLTANAQPADTDYPGATWTTSNPEVATVDASGLVRGISSGTATITGTSIFGGFTGTCEITVVDEVELPQYDETVYAYNIYDDAGILPMGFVSYSIDDTPGNIKAVANGEISMYAAGYYDGLIYAYEFVDYWFFYTLGYAIIDASTFTVIDYYDITEAAMVALDMTYDYSNDIMYALSLQVATGATSLSTVDMNTGEFIAVGDLTLKDGAQMLTLAAITNGDLYGIGTDSIYYSINKDDATVDAISEMPYVVGYVQTMTYNFYDNNMYWFQINDEESNLVVFDAETGDVSADGSLGSGFVECVGSFVYADPSTFPTSEHVDVTGVTITPETVEIAVGSTYKLKAQIEPRDATNKNVTWKSNNPAVATINESGVVTAVHPGTALITATTVEGGFTASAQVTVLQPPASDLEEGMARVTLTAPDVWGDGTGYQMLIDADATAYGTVFFAGQPLGTGDVSASVYEQFEYKIPENADGALDTSNIVFNNSITIDIPAGVYDWCITNPTPGDKMYIANEARADDYVFEEGFAYEFAMSLGSNYDKLTITSTYIGTYNPNPITYYKVDFLDYDDSLYASYMVEEGGDAILPEEPTRAHWLFYGWTGGEHTNVTEDRVLKALYYKYGDANIDGNVNTGDAALVLMSVIDDSILIDEFAIKLADMNENGEVNTGDAAMILQIVVGLLPEPW